MSRKSEDTQGAKAVHFSSVLNGEADELEFEFELSAEHRQQSDGDLAASVASAVAATASQASPRRRSLARSTL